MNARADGSQFFSVALAITNIVGAARSGFGVPFEDMSTEMAVNFLKVSRNLESCCSVILTKRRSSSCYNFGTSSPSASSNYRYCVCTVDSSPCAAIPRSYGSCSRFRSAGPCPFSSQHSFKFGRFGAIGSIARTLRIMKSCICARA